MKNWEISRLAALSFRIGSGITPRGGANSYKESGIPLIRSQNVHRLEFRNRGLAFIDPDTDQKMQQSRVFPWDNLLNITGASIGRNCVVPENICPANVNQHVAVIRCNELLDPKFLSFVLASERIQRHIDDLQSGATRQALTKGQIENFQIPHPPLAEQKRIAAELDEQLASIEIARAAAERQVEAAERLGFAFVAKTFASLAENLTRIRLSEIADLLPSKAISTKGDCEIRAITSGCLQPTGFSIKGIKPARMHSSDVEEAKVKKGEILISRSNTKQFVGRVVQYLDEDDQFCASDLIIRLWADETTVNSRFLTHFLSQLQAGGYWHDNSNGANDSMKKITRSHIRSLEIPLPDLATQQAIVTQLDGQLAAQRETLQAGQTQLKAIQALPAAVLRGVFG